MLLGQPPSAWAAEGEALVAATLSAGGATGVNPAAPTLVGGLDGWWGLSEFFWLQVSAAGGGPFSGNAGAGLEGLLGGVLAIDVVQWVPWFEALAGVAVALDENPVAAAPAGRIGLGIDRVLDFSWALGAFFRVHLGPRAIGGPRWMGGLRVAYRLEL